MKDYYKILEVDKNASEEDVKKAYRKMAHKHHPDKNGGDDARFKEVNEAYQILSDKKKRSQYDQFGSAGFDGSQGGFGGFGGGSNGFHWDFSSGSKGGFADIFEDLFGGFSSGGATQQQRSKGADLQVSLTLDLEDSAFGNTKEIGITRMAKCATCAGSGAEPKSDIIKCSACSGRGVQEKMFRTFFGVMKQQVVCEECYGLGNVPKEKCKNCSGDGVKKEKDIFSVKIPAGINNGEVFRISKKGDDMAHGGESGDLFVHVSLRAHKTFSRDGDDLKLSIPINFTQAAFGDKVKINTLYGDVNLKIPAGIQSGKVIKISGYGMPKKSKFSGKGDLLAEVNINTPASLTKKQKALLEELQKEGL